MLSDKERELLVCLAEEAAEIIKAVEKILRHGKYSYYPERDDSYLWNEINDFACIQGQLVELGPDYGPFGPNLGPEKEVDALLIMHLNT